MELVASWGGSPYVREDSEEDKGSARQSLFQVWFLSYLQSSHQRHGKRKLSRVTASDTDDTPRGRHATPCTAGATGGFEGMPYLQDGLVRTAMCQILMHTLIACSAEKDDGQ